MNRKKQTLITPEIKEAPPSPGIRVRQIAPEYEGTRVYHSLYLPVNWKPYGKYPVIVEYTGNKWADSGSTGKVDDANLGFGISGGENFIWVTMPCIEKGKRENALTWWGDREATMDYCKKNLPRICRDFRGDWENIIICGFSRGAIAISHIGLADDEIASFWKCFIAHDHFDGERSWDYPESDRASALDRLSRLKGRPVLISSMNKEGIKNHYLKNHAGLGQFSFLYVPTEQLFHIPEGPVIHPHTDLWMHKESVYRDQVREWVNLNSNTRIGKNSLGEASKASFF